MKSKEKKRGISPLVATILLVGFVIALIVIIILWSRAYMEELIQKRGAIAEIEAKCPNVGFTVLDASKSGDYINLVIQNNKDVEIGKFLFRVKGDKGYDIHSITPKLKLLETAEFPLIVDAEKTGKVELVEIIPWLKVAKQKYIPCSGQAVEAKIK